MNKHILLLSAFLLGPIVAMGAAHAAPPKKGVTVEGITEYALDNGLRVLLFPDGSKPTVTVNVTYLVGSRHEGYGETGMAHLLEHMMFKGTKRHPKVLGQLEARGAKLNGTTDYDRTNYFEILSAEKDNLAFALDLESDRMVNATISQEDLSTEFSVVRNEFEMGENSPPEILEERMLSSAYLWHNYGKSTIGSRSDIERVPAESLRAFYKKFYQPDNALVVIAGKFEPQQALSLVDKYFGKIPRPARKLQPTYTVEPVQDGERAVTLRRTGDVQIAGLMYHGAAGADPDYVAESAIIDILTAEPSGRLQKALVEPGLAAKVRGGAYPWAEPGVMELVADVRKDKSAEQVRDKMVEVVEGLAKGKITDAELERWRAKTAREIELGLTNPERIGIELSEWAAQGDWRLKFIHRDRVKALTTADVQRVATKFLKGSNRTVGLFLPTASPDRAPLPETPDVVAMVKSYKGNANVAQGEAFEASIENIEKRTQRVTLPSGMKLALLSKKTRGGAVDLTLHVRAGNESDLKGLTEVAALMRRMVVRGTKHHTYQQIQDTLDKLKAELKPTMGFGGGSDPGSALFTISTVRESVPAVLALLGEIVREPAFAKDEFEKLKKEELAELEAQLQQPMVAGFVALQQKAMPWPKDDVRYQPSLAEQIERLQAVRVEQLQQFHERFWGGQGATLVLVGDFDGDKVKKTVDHEFAAWKAQKPWQRITMPFRAAKPTDETIRTPDKQMAFVGAAMPIEMRDDDPEYPAVTLADFIYGGGARSRVWERLREKEGLSYGTFSFVNANSFEKNALFLSGAICAPQNAAKAMEGLVGEMKKLVDEGVRDTELREHKQAYQAKFSNDLASDEFVSLLLDRSLYTGRTLAFQAELNQKVQQLSSSQVVSAMRKWVRPDSLVKVKVGDLK
jgi:zinc protease